MLAVSLTLKNRPLASNAGILALFFMVFLGLSPNKVEASIIFPPLSPPLSESLFGVEPADDFGISHLIVRSFVGSFTRTDEFFGNCFSHDLVNTKSGASNSSRSQVSSKDSRKPAPSDDDLQLISRPTWMILVGVSASDGSGCSSTAVPDSDLSGRFSEGLTTRILCAMPVVIRLHWLRSRDLVHIPKAHVSELLRPPQVSGALS